MKKTFITTLALSAFISFSAGCESLRIAPTQAQKQNAWLHNQTAWLAANIAKSEDASDKLKGLTELSAVQSRAFVRYYGIPKQLPSAYTAEEILEQSNWQLAKTAASDATQRPDVWKLADNTIELAIGIAALLGGIYGTRAAAFLKQARNKSKALHEVIQGNELFKNQNVEAVDAFKIAHKNQSTQTKQLITKMKNPA